MEQLTDSRKDPKTSATTASSHSVEALLGSPPSTTVPSRSERRHAASEEIFERSVLLLLVILALLGGVHASIEGITLRESSNPSVEIPNLVGVRSIEEAQEAVGDNFIIEGVQVESGEAVGTIVSQDPKAGKIAGKGSTISVEISGKQILPLPNVEGRTLDEAVQSIRGRPFALDVKTRESSAQEENLVIEQEPRGGEGVTAEAGTRVTVTVGEGPAPVKVPDLYNLSPEAAKRVLEKAGLSLGNQTKLPNERIPAGQIVDQLTVPGTGVKPGSSVDIVTSSGPAQVPVWNVTGYDADEYATSLELAF